MKAIHISNSKKRDAEVAVDTHVRGRTVRTVLPDGSDKVNVKILKATQPYAAPVLSARYGTPEEMASAIVEGDPEVDMESAGRILRRTHKLYIDADGMIAYSLSLYRVIFDPDGEELERRELNKLPSNINTEIPVGWTGRRFSRSEAIRRFVFSRKYQIRHINGVTYDFLYNMARELDEQDEMVLLGAGAKGNDPLLLTRGGQPYRGLLEGRVEGENYCLLLHLTDIELSGLE